MDADPTLADRQPVGPDLALAIQLEHRATQNAIVRSYGIMPSSRPEDDDLDRAAAVRLRKLDAAIADVRAEFAQALSDDAETSGFLTWIERLDTVLADALGGTEP